MNFFGDEIDGIRIFDPESQRSVENVEEVQLKAVSDLLLQEEDFIRGQQQIEQLQEQSANKEFKSYLAEILGDISQRKLHPDLRKFISLYRNNILYSIIFLNTLQSFWMIIKK